MDLDKHISGQFTQELELVRTMVLQMGGLVEQQLTDALHAVHCQNVDLAEDVVLKDQHVNRLEATIGEECTRIIAKRQPAASDLRLVMVIIKIITELERIGDGTGSLARIVLNHGERPDTQLASLENMGFHTVSMLHDVLDAFARMDVDSALRVHREDHKVDKQYESLSRELMTYMVEDPRSIPRIIKIFNAARTIERIGDRCQNISEYIAYFVKGKDIRHTDTEGLEDLQNE